MPSVDHLARRLEERASPVTRDERLGPPITDRYDGVDARLASTVEEELEQGGLDQGVVPAKDDDEFGIDVSEPESQCNQRALEPGRLEHVRASCRRPGTDDHRPRHDWSCGCDDGVEQGSAVDPGSRLV